MNSMLYTIGHSNHEPEVFLGLLRQHGVTAVGDVRSHPYSRYVPQFSRESLEAALTAAGIAYVFLGKELARGATIRPATARARSSTIAWRKSRCLSRGYAASGKGCSNTESRFVRGKGPPGLSSGIAGGPPAFRDRRPRQPHSRRRALESHQALELRLLAVCKFPEGDLFTSRQEFIADAYRLRGERVAYQAQAAEQGEEAVVP